MNAGVTDLLPQRIFVIDTRPSEGAPAVPLDLHKSESSFSRTA